MQIIKQITYIETSQGWQTYYFNQYYQPIKYKLLLTFEELQNAITACHHAGWSISNGTNLVRFLRQQTTR